MPSLDDIDLVYNLNNTNLNDHYSARIFQVEDFSGATRTIALVDLICGGYESYAVLEKDLLTAILFDSIVQLDLSTGQVVQFKECDNVGGLFEIHAIPDGYILWGEGGIFRYDPALNCIWNFMGRDILVSLKADKHFWIEDGLIHSRDFLGYHYILDLNGTLLQKYLEFKDPETR